MSRNGGFDISWTGWRSRIDAVVANRNYAGSRSITCNDHAWQIYCGERRETLLFTRVGKKPVDPVDRPSFASRQRLILVSLPCCSKRVLCTYLASCILLFDYLLNSPAVGCNSLSLRLSVVVQLNEDRLRCTFIPRGHKRLGPVTDWLTDWLTSSSDVHIM